MYFFIRVNNPEILIITQRTYWKIWILDNCKWTNGSNITGNYGIEKYHNFFNGFRIIESVLTSLLEHDRNECEFTR